MKKILTLFLVVFGAVQMSRSQDVFFRFDGKTLENSSWVEIGAQPDSFFPDVKNCMTNNHSDPSSGLFLVAPPNSSVSATLEILSNTLSPLMVQWCMGGLCQVMAEDQSLEKSFTVEDDGCMAVEFDANGVGNEGQLEAKLTAMVGSNSISVNIRFVGSTTTCLERIDDGKTADSKCYNLHGRPCPPNHRGVTIQKGKKYVNR